MMAMNVALGQVKSELVWPVVPIAEKCMVAFDDTSTMRVVSLKDFQKISRVWMTQNNCVGEEVDTIYASSFTVMFSSLRGTNSFYTATDGRLDNEYLNSMTDAVKNCKKSTKIFFNQVQYEKEGVFYQIPGFVLVIDSLVNPIKDTCWRVLPLGSCFYTLTKDSIINLLQNHLAYNRCTGEQGWVDTSLQARSTLWPYRTYANMMGISSKVFDINNKKELSELIDSIKAAKNGYRLDIEPLVYEKDKKMYLSSRLSIEIDEKMDCYHLFDRDSSNVTLSKIELQTFKKLWVQKNYCEKNTSVVEVLSAKIVFAPLNGNASMIRIGSSTLPTRYFESLQRLRPGDRVRFQNIKITVDGQQHFIKSVVFTLK